MCASIAASTAGLHPELSHLPPQQSLTQIMLQQFPGFAGSSLRALNGIYITKVPTCQ